MSFAGAACCPREFFIAPAQAHPFGESQIPRRTTSILARWRLKGCERSFACRMPLCNADSILLTRQALPSMIRGAHTQQAELVFRTHVFAATPSARRACVPARQCCPAPCPVRVRTACVTVHAQCVHNGRAGILRLHPAKTLRLRRFVIVAGRVSAAAATEYRRHSIQQFHNLQHSSKRRKQ